MGRIDALRAEVEKLYKVAKTIRNGDDRLVYILRALELETVLDAMEYGADSPPPHFDPAKLTRIKG